MNRTSAAWFLVAFGVIGVLTLIEGINDGFTLLNWVVVAVSVGFAGQAVWTLVHDTSSHAGRVSRLRMPAFCPQM